MKSNNRSAWQKVGRVNRGLVLLPLLAIFATQPPAVWAGINVWTGIGPDGGYVQALAIDPQEPSTIYTATSGAGVFKSKDGGANWNAVNSGLTTLFISTLAIDPQNPGTVYAGPFKSIDGGQSWVPIGHSVLAIDPRNPSTVYAARGNGVFKSTDGGANWSALNSGLPAANVNALVIDPQNSSTLYVVGGLCCPSAPVFKSTDGGASWSAASSGLPTYSGGPPSGVYYFAVKVLAIDPQNPSTVYAGTERGVFKSTNGGMSWRIANSGLPNSAVLSLIPDPQKPGTVYAVNVGVFKSVDGGESWTAVNSSGLPERSSVSTLAIDPQDPSTIYAGAYAGTESGLFKSTDGATSWSPVNSGLRAAVVNALWVVPENPSAVYAATSIGFVKSMDGGSSWMRASSELWSHDTPIALAASPQDPSTLYAGAAVLSCCGDGIFKSTDGGESWSAASSGLPSRSSVTALAMDSQNPSQLYAALSWKEYDGGSFGSIRNGVFKTADGGASWSAVNSGLPDGGVGPLAIDPQNPSTVYAGTSGVFKSTDGGASWNAVNSGLPTYIDVRDGRTHLYGVGALAIDPKNPSTVYAATYVGVFKSTDGGANWVVLNSKLLDDRYVGVLVIDPKTPSTLYAATFEEYFGLPYGVFKSTDGGANWSALNSGLPATGVNSLAIDPQNPSTVYAGTNGSGVFAITSVP